jgi:5-methylcytosine-specific restriction enzyme A
MVRACQRARWHALHRVGELVLSIASRRLIDRKPWDMANPKFKKLYNSKRWKILQAQQLQDYPLCAMCLLDNRVTAAQVADHITPHRGNVDLCWHHHSKTKQEIECRGFSGRVDVNGRPIDPDHPANQ